MDGPREWEAEGWWIGVPSREEVLAEDEVIGWVKNGSRAEDGRKLVQGQRPSPNI